MPQKDLNPGQHEGAAERRLQSFDLRKAGLSYRAIGGVLGISEAQAHRDVQATLASLAELEQGKAEEYRALELARLDDLMLAATRILRATHPLVSGGKVLSGFTEEGKPIGLTDDGPKLAAIAELRRISESRRKLLGLDAQPDGGNTTINILVQQQWLELRAVILSSLSAYPDARAALTAALVETYPDE
jgi:hypothetical protein